MKIEDFILRIPEFGDLSPADLIKYFVYYCQTYLEQDAVRPADVLNCYTTLHLNPYSNIPSYLSRHSKKKQKQEFLKRSTGYVLLMEIRKRIEVETLPAPIPVIAKPSDSLFPLEIFNDTRGYLMVYAKEASVCYDYALYNSCLFMLRKISEILIIDLFDRTSLTAKIKKASGGYFQLGELISSLKSEQTWHLSKITKENFPKIKLLGDSSVHSKRFKAKKPDIDNMKLDVRIAFEEIIALIDYPNWKSA